MYPGKPAASCCQLLRSVVSAPSPNSFTQRCWTNERMIGQEPAMFRHASQDVDAPDRTSVIGETLALEHCRNQHGWHQSQKAVTTGEGYLTRPLSVGVHWGSSFFSDVTRACRRGSSSWLLI